MIVEHKEKGGDTLAFAGFRGSPSGRKRKERTREADGETENL